MFTGIIQELGTVVSAQKRDGLIRLAVEAPTTAAAAHAMDSIAVNGACLTLVRARDGVMEFDVIPETQRLTSLHGLRAGARVNLEPSLRVTDRLSGHLVFGHVDGLGTIAKRRQQAGELILEIRLPSSLGRFVVSKGPIAIDGVSLTVGHRHGTSSFTVHLIPETLRLTALGARRAGERVNIELDYFAKLIRQFVQR